MPDGKEFRPVRRTSNGWEVGAMPPSRPLYRLNEVSLARRVYVAEGEKAADALREIGLTATTSAGGCKAAHQTDWSPLGGKECVILPDNDPAGEDYLTDVLDLLGRIQPQPITRIVRLPGLPSAGDAVEFIAARRAAGLSDAAIRAEIEQIADQTPSVDLGRAGRRTWRPFPVDVLPEPLREFVLEGAAAMVCDPSMIALPALAACAAAIGTTRRVKIKKTWAEPAIVWCAVVSPSGTMKSPALEYALAPLQKAQETRFREYQELMDQYEEELDHYEADIARWRRAKPEDRGERPKKPQPPPCVRYLVQDITIEGLAPILEVNRRGVFLAIDELAGWFTGFNQYKPKGGSDVANWLQLHRAGLLIVDRKTGAKRTIYVPGAAVSVCGTVQPGTLQNLLTREFFEAGLPARLLLAAPPVTRKRWSEKEVEPATIARFEALVLALLGLKHHVSDQDELVPIEIALSPEARRLFIEWYNENAELIERADDDDIRAVLAKIESYAVRFALVIHCIKCVAQGISPDRPIDGESMAAGKTLARWFAEEAERVYGLWHESDEQRELRKLAETARRRATSGEVAGTVSVREWQRARSHKTADAAQKELGRLVDAGFGSWDSPKQAGSGHPAGPRYRPLDDPDSDKTHLPQSENGDCVSVRAVRGVPESPASVTPEGEPDESDQGHSDAVQYVEGQQELGLPIEPDPKSNQRWATEA